MAGKYTRTRYENDVFSSFFLEFLFILVGSGCLSIFLWILLCIYQRKTTQFLLFSLLLFFWLFLRCSTSLTATLSHLCRSLFYHSTFPVFISERTWFAVNGGNEEATGYKGNRWIEGLLIFVYARGTKIDPFSDQPPRSKLQNYSRSIFWRMIKVVNMTMKYQTFLSIKRLRA